MIPGAPVNTEIDTNIAPDRTTNDQVQSGSFKKNTL